MIEFPGLKLAAGGNSLSPEKSSRVSVRGSCPFRSRTSRPDYKLNLESYRRHVEWLSGFEAAALFAAGGTGEFFSLSPNEVGQVTRAAKDVSGEVPIIAGCGYGTSLCRRDREDRRGGGCRRYSPAAALPDGSAAGRHLCPCEGRLRFAGRASFSTTAPIRSPMPTRSARLAEACPNLIGFKDGTGKVDLVRHVTARLGDRLCDIGGMPTHELFAEGFNGVGVTTYSSAVFNFVPELAQRFYRAMRAATRR